MKHLPNRFDRRGVLRLMGGAALSVTLLGSLGISHAVAQDAAVAQQVADHFSRVKTMTGEFVQFGPRGEQTGGKFYLQRPGKIRFDYEGKNGYRVTADGTSVVIDNKKLRTADLYPLSKTPLKLLLDSRIDLSGNKVQQVKQEPDMTTIKLADRSVFGNSTITMMFDPTSYTLKQWTITDAQNKDTTVMIFNTKEGVSFDPSVFAIDYNRVNQMNVKGPGGR
ncbi:outer membrane lipoprotein carrier protein LolA [Tianweitania sp. BSSL-BM11]|uniref:Outer membrane lipoprotein carrier protein LolA n=2 Tax=Tianweitania aestuarii TaxID=2814886 RepID=A0ABS5RX38_9HYPH|nr:outer-membrane lipoprotein carrier protein LolA [Tianweitania aestuarii]MBS9721603.1 outer membrane lipoprotein carrier protein LolA [Tianweitania aestuarii]